MRIVIAGDKFWSCSELAESISRRLLTRFGPDVVIAFGGAPGVDHSFSTACGRLGVKVDLYLANFGHLGDFRFGNRELLRRRAEMCLIVHRPPLDEPTKDMARQAIAAGIPTYLIDSD